MPVYNVEQYLERAVRSVLDQTLPDWELIIVDDGSTDNSGTIADRLAGMDRKISVIHQQNYGLGPARNTGMRAAGGKYLLFIDSDDWIELKTLRALTDIAERNNAQIVMFGRYNDFLQGDGSILTERVYHKDIVYPTQRHMRENIVHTMTNFLFNSACSKLYRLKLIREHGYRFTNTRMIEDVLFNLEVFRHVERVIVVSDCYYHYVQHSGETLTSKYYPDLFALMTLQHERKIELFTEWGILNNLFENQLLNIYLSHIFQCMLSLYITNCPLTKREKHLRIREMLSHKSVQEVIRKVKPGSNDNSILHLLLNTGSPFLITSFCRTLAVARTRYARIFRILRGGRQG